MRSASINIRMAKTTAVVVSAVLSGFLATHDGALGTAHATALGGFSLSALLNSSPSPSSLAKRRGDPNRHSSVIRHLCFVVAEPSCAELKRREDACALRKLRKTERECSLNFARSAFGVRCVLASLSPFEYFALLRLPRRSLGGGGSFQIPSQARWAIDKFPWNFKSFRQMRSEGFHAENFCSVMAAEQKIHAEFFSRHGGPVRGFASNKCVDVFLRDAVDFRAGGAGHNAD